MMLRGTICGEGGVILGSRITRILLALMMMCGVATTASAENLITNPNFVGVDEGLILSAPTNIEGWTIGTNVRVFHLYSNEIDTGAWTGACATPGGGDVTYFGNSDTSAAFLGATGAMIGTAVNTRTVTTTPMALESGTTYHLKLDWALVNYAQGKNYFGPAGIIFTLRNDAGEEVVTGAFDSGLDTGWENTRVSAPDGWITTSTEDFTVNETGNYTLELATIGTVTQYWNRTFVSNVVLTPEPGTWAMLSGLGLIGAAWYRRQRSR